MRVKNTLFTAIAAGIVFLSGMVILGKNALIKKVQDKKDLTPIKNTHNTESELDIKHNETVIVADTNLFDKVELNPVAEKQLKTQSKDERLLLQMVNEMLRARQIDTLNFNMRKAVGMRGELRAVSNLSTHRQTPIQNQKLVCKIREPSGSASIELANRSGNAKDIGDKGG